MSEQEVPGTWPDYRQMTPAQMLAWGHAEREARMADLSVRTPAGLKLAQDNAAARRRAIGASTSVAASMVQDASRENRLNEQRAELARARGEKHE